MCEKRRPSTGSIAIRFRSVASNGLDITTTLGGRSGRDALRIIHWRLIVMIGRMPVRTPLPDIPPFRR